MPSFFKKVKSFECWPAASRKKDVEIRWSQRKPAAASTVSKLRFRTFRFRTFLFRSEAFPVSLLGVFFWFCFRLPCALNFRFPCLIFFVLTFFEALPFRKHPNALSDFFLFFALFLSFLQASFFWHLYFPGVGTCPLLEINSCQKSLCKSCDFKINSVDGV